MFTPFLVNQENPSFIINTGSKQGAPYVMTDIHRDAPLTIIYIGLTYVHRLDRSSWKCCVQRLEGQLPLRADFPKGAATDESLLSLSPQAAVRMLTEQLAHELREAHSTCSAHCQSFPVDSRVTSRVLTFPFRLAVFVPGWTHTGMTGAKTGEKPAGAWSAKETVGYLVEKLEKGDFVSSQSAQPRSRRVRPVADLRSVLSLVWYSISAVHHLPRQRDDGSRGPTQVRLGRVGHTAQQARPLAMASRL